jgi:hypothetical protein
MDKDDNVILFPTGRIVNKETAKQDPVASEKVKEAKTREFVEGNVDQIAMFMLRHFVEMAMRTNSPHFTKDLALLVDVMRGMIYRDFDVQHPAQYLADKIVDVEMTRFGPKAVINYNRVLPDLNHKPHKPFSKELKDDIKWHNDGWTNFEPDFEFDDEPDEH